MQTPNNTLPSTGFLRLSQIVWNKDKTNTPLIPIAAGMWWAGIRNGLYPKGIKLGPRTTVWRLEDILAFIAHPPGAFKHGAANLGDKYGRPKGKVDPLDNTILDADDSPSDEYIFEASDSFGGGVICENTTKNRAI